MTEIKKHWVFLALMGLALTVGLALGYIAKGLMTLDVVSRLLVLGVLAFIGVGACFFAAFCEAEREHERKLAMFIVDGGGSMAARSDSTDDYAYEGRLRRVK